LPKQSHGYLPLIYGIASSLRSSQRHKKGVIVQALFSDLKPPQVSRSVIYDNWSNMAYWYLCNV